MSVASEQRVKISLPTDLELRMTRVFEGARELVFDALTKPELLRRWYGPPPERGWTIMTCTGEVKKGGAWRIVLSHSKGKHKEIVVHGVYREVSRPERYVSTQLMEGCDAHGDCEAIVTTTLAEDDGRTTFETTIRYPSKEVRDRVLTSGTTEEGVSAVYDKLAAFLASAHEDAERGRR